MRIDHEELLARNPALTASAFWHLARRHADKAHGAAPVLPVFIVATAMLFHRATVDKIHPMQFDSGMLKAVVERPDLLAGLQARVEDHADAALNALQVGVSSGLLGREGGDGFPRFRALGGGDLPAAIKDFDPPISHIMAAAKRLGVWFAIDGFETVRRQLNIEF